MIYNLYALVYVCKQRFTPVYKRIRRFIWRCFLAKAVFHKAWDAYMQEVVLSEWG